MSKKILAAFLAVLTIFCFVSCATAEIEPLSVTTEYEGADVQEIYGYIVEWANECFDKKAITADDAAKTVTVEYTYDGISSSIPTQYGDYNFVITAQAFDGKGVCTISYVGGSVKLFNVIPLSAGMSSLGLWEVDTANQGILYTFDGYLTNMLFMNHDYAEWEKEMQALAEEYGIEMEEAPAK